MLRRVGYAHVEQGRLGQADQPSRLVDIVRRVPARHGEHPAWRQARHEVPPTLHRVKPILREREGANPGRCPRVDHAHLHEIELAIAPHAGEPAARFVHFQAHAREIGEVVEVAEAAGEVTDENRVELDAGDVAEAEQIGGQQVAPAAHPDDRRAALVTNVIGEAGDVVFEKIHLLQIAAEAIHRGPRIAVDVHVALIDLGFRHGRRGAPHCRRFVHGLLGADARIRIPLHVFANAGVLGLAFGEGQQQSMRMNRCIAEREQREHHEEHAGPMQHAQPARQNDRPRFRIAAAAREGEGRRRAERADHQHGRHTIERAHQHQRAEATEGGAGEVKAVDQPDRPGTARQRQRDAHAGENIGRHQRGDQLKPEHGRQDEAESGVEQNRRDQNDGRQHDGDGERRGDPAQIRQQTLGREEFLVEVDDERTGGHAEHRHADGEEGEMIVTDHRQNARLDDLQHENACAQEKQSAEESDFSGHQ